MMKRKVFIATGLISTAIAPVSVFAESASGTANTDVVTAMTTVANDMQATASSIIPIALGVVGIAIVVVFGIRIFKKIIGK